MDDENEDMNLDVNLTDVNPDMLIFYAYRHSAEMGKAAEAVLKGKPTKEQVDRLYALVKRNGGDHLSRDVYMALLDAVRRASGSH